MIPSRDTAHLVQDAAGNWTVVGTPKPAEGVPPPPLNAPLPEEAPPAPPAPPAPRVLDPRELTVRTPRAGSPAVPGFPVPQADAAPRRTRRRCAGARAGSGGAAGRTRRARGPRAGAGAQRSRRPGTSCTASRIRSDASTGARCAHRARAGPGRTGRTGAGRSRTGRTGAGHSGTGPRRPARTVQPARGAGGACAGRRRQCPGARRMSRHPGRQGQTPKPQRAKKASPGPGHEAGARRTRWLLPKPVCAARLSCSGTAPETW